MGLHAVLVLAWWPLACTGSEEGVTWDLTLLPVVAEKNQDPFDGLDSHSLQVTGPNTSEFREMTQEGSTVSLGGLGELSGATITYRGSLEHQVVSLGRTAPVTISDGETLEVPIFVGEVDAMAWLSERGTKEGIYGGAVAPGGDGRYFLFGGMDFGTGGSMGDTFDHIQILDLGTPSDDPVFETVGTMPAYDDAGSTHTERMGLTATTLNDADDLEGQILVTGGTATWQNGSTTTGTAFLYDPDTGEIYEFSNDDWLYEERNEHIAVQNAQGDVVLFGGWGRAIGGGLVIVDDIEVYDRSQGERGHFETLGNRSIGIFGAADLLGVTAGVLHCGGVKFAGNQWYTDDQCYLVSPNGEVDELSAPMPLDLGHHTLTWLEEGKVLLAGGVSVGDDITQQGDIVDASAEAWIYDHDLREFIEVDDMAVPRAAHAAVPLGNGRVLVVGGAAEVSDIPFSDNYSGEPMACGEIFDLATRSWTSADGCLAGDASGALEVRSISPVVGNDPDHGAVIMGGATVNWSATQTVGFWTFRR